jgi:hypothetical protein
MKTTEMALFTGLYVYSVYGMASHESLGLAIFFVVVMIAIIVNLRIELDLVSHS